MLGKFLDVVGRYSGKKAAFFVIGVAAEMIVLAFSIEPGNTQQQCAMYAIALQWIPVLVAGCAIGQGIADFGQKWTIPGNPQQ